MHKIHGVAFLVLATAAWLFGMKTTISFSLFWGMLDLLVIVASFAAVIFFYCAKCPARKACSHVVPGYLTGFFPKRRTEPYSVADITVMALAFIIMTAFPLYWLAKDLRTLLIYVIVLSVAVIELRLNVCKDCRNIYCVLKSHKK